MKIRLLSTMCAYLLTATIPAFGSAIYNYTGNTFDSFSAPYTSSMAVTGTIELNAPLSANLSLADVSTLSFSFSDGINTIDSGFLTSFIFSTDNSGNITQWLIAVGDSGIGRSIFTNSTGAANDSDGTCFFADCDLRQSSYGFNESFSGSWSVSTVPVPAAAWLMGSGLLGLISVARRKHVLIRNKY